MPWFVHRASSLMVLCSLYLLIISLKLQYSSSQPTTTTHIKTHTKTHTKTHIHTATHTTTHTYNLYGKPGDGYYTQVEIGTPPQKFNVLVDTGSSNLAIAGAQHDGLHSYFIMKNSSTYQHTEQEVNVVYTQGSWKGHMGRDIVRFPDLPEALPVITDIAIITTSNKFFVNNSHWQGIVGLAYRALSQPQGKSVPWLDGVLTQQQHLNNTITLKLCGPDKREAYASHYGRLFIGSDQGDCPPPVVTTPVKRAWFYEVLVVEIEVGNRSINLPCASYNTDKSIVDSGTSNLLLPPKVFKAVVAELQSHTVSLIPSLSDEFWVGNEEVCWPEDHQAWDVFPNITVHLAYDNTSAFSIIVPPKSYLRPAQDKDSTCWVIGLDQSHTGTVLGTVVLEGLCLTFHRDRSVIGFSESTCGPPITLGNIDKSAVDFESCVYVSRGVSGLTLASYIMGALLGITGLPLILATIRFACRWNVSPRLNHEVPFSTLDDVST